MSVTRPLAAALALVLTAAPATAQQISPEHYDQLRFRHIGPVGNRVASIAGVPGDRTTYYAGAASGGVWKTEDAGLHWDPVFDDQPVHSIGALAVAPSDRAIVWAGTGETSIRSNVSIGNGVWKSTDGGESWTHMGLEGTGRIGRILVHPYDPEVVYVAALGHAYAPQLERGVYRTTNGGETWEKVLSVDETTGAYALAMDPHDPRKIFATFWQIDLKTWGRESGGPGSGIFVTKDGGGAWRRLEGHGLPEKPVGKIDVCLSAGDSDRVYALIETGDGVPIHGEETDTGELWRSEDGGDTWRLVSHSHEMGGRQAYYTRCAVAPDDEDEIFFASSNWAWSKDGGETHETSNFLRDTSSPGWDIHDIWIDPEDGDRMALAFDGGVALTEDRGDSWFRIQLPIAQMYHVTVDDAVPYHVLGNRQDGPSFRGPSNTRYDGLWAGGLIPRGDWRGVGGGESGFATPDPTDPNIVWSSASGFGARGGIVVRHDVESGQFRNVEVWPMSTGGWPAEELRYRFQWTFPLLISPHDHETIYVTSQHVHRTTNRGQSWEVISPDLTTNDKSRQGISGGLTPDNIGVEYCCVIYAFDESPVEPGVLWAGTNDGLVHVSRDGGATWAEVTQNIPDLPPDGVVRSIDASRWSAGKAYLTIEHHQVGDFAPRAYRTEDFGASWTPIVSGVDDGPLSYTRYLLEDPVRPGLLYLGTEASLYVSFDDGASWQKLMPNLPPAPYYGLVVQERFNDLVVGTYGRGYWILDDLGPLQQLTPEVAASDAHLFEPRDAYRFRPVTEPMITFEDWTHGENPPFGAVINYWLGSEPSDSVKIRIVNAAGDTVRTLEGTKHVGINRLWWDFQGEPTTEIRLRTKPRYAEWFPMPDEGWRSGGSRIRALQPPGAYTVVLEVDGESYARPLEVVKDPNSEGDLQQIREQFELVTELRDDLDRAASMVNRVELIRRQVLDLKSAVTAEGGGAEIAAAADSLEADLVEFEEDLIQLKITGGQDGVRWPAMLVERIAYLAGAVETADFRPTDQHREVHEILHARLADAEARLDELLSTEVAAFGRLLEEREIGPIVTEPPPDP